MRYVLFCHGFTVAFEDARLAQSASSLFAAKCICSNYRGNVALRVNGRLDSFEICFGNNCQGAIRNVAAANVIGLIDDSLNYRLRSAVPSECCSVHASALNLGGSAVVLVGESGFGKTTLCLAAADCGVKMLGDEFGLIDFNTRSYVQANYPFCLKAGSRAVLKTLGNALPSGALMVSPLGVRSEVLPVSSVDQTLRSLGRPGLETAMQAQCGELTAPLPLKAIVSIRRGARSNSMETLNVGMWLAEVMPSLDGPCTRAYLFNQLVKLASNGVMLKRMSFVNLYDGARLLIEEFGC